jgi:hypothetical protein
MDLISLGHSTDFDGTDYQSTKKQEGYALNQSLMRGSGIIPKSSSAYFARERTT